VGDERAGGVLINRKEENEMGPLFLKSHAVCDLLQISRSKLLRLEQEKCLTRVHLRFKKTHKGRVPADHGWFKREDVLKLMG